MQEHEVLNAIRALVAAAEEAGWDNSENADVLNAGREAYAVLVDVMGIPLDEQSEQHLPKAGA